MRFLPTRIHGIMDYIAGILLIVAPWLLGFSQGGAETWVPVSIGAGMLLMAFFTRYELGVVRVIPMPLHLMMDVVAGIVLAISPWLFQFDEIVWIPHLVLGLAEIAGALTTETQPGYLTHGRGFGV